MITFNSISDGSAWAGADWTITNENELAEMIARVALGQSRHVEKILSETSFIEYPPQRTAEEGAIKLLTASDPEKPWHRDGWIFQVISWIAANIQNPKSIKSPPHMIHAHKGFDSLHLCLDDSNENIVFVIVCEEKATTGPRGKITSQVWPDFSSLEVGTKDHQLISETTALLTQCGHLDPERAVYETLWNKVRAYRISITVGGNEHSIQGRKNLFNGYEETAPGNDVNKRRAETFYQQDLRDWMKKVAEKAIKKVKELEAQNV